MNSSDKNSAAGCAILYFANAEYFKIYLATAFRIPRFGTIILKILVALATVTWQQPITGLATYFRPSFC